MRPWTDTAGLSIVGTTTTAPTPHHHRHHHRHHFRRLGSQVLRASVIFVDTLASDLSTRAHPLVSSVGSAVRRRERRLRSFWRHEQMAVQMALASVTLVPGGHRARRSTEPEACHQRLWDAAASSRRGAAAGAYPAAHRGADDQRLAVRPDPRRSCAAGGGSRVGVLSPPGPAGRRAGY